MRGELITWLLHELMYVGLVLLASLAVAITLGFSFLWPSPWF
jgi:hypothetical protein